MKIGVFSLMQWPEDRSALRVYQDEIGQAEEAERLGYDRVWLAEHHFSRYGIAPSIHLVAAAIAARTHRLRIGTAVTIVPFFHPLRIAEEIAMLDLLSEGRIDWGAGRGYQRHEFDAFGVPIADSESIFREQLEIIRKAWTGERVSHDGPHYRFESVEVLPRPLQRPHPPLWVAAISPKTIEWAAREGYAVLADQFAPFHFLAESRQRYAALARARGDDPAGRELPVLRQVFVGRTTAEARAAAGPALLWYYRTLARVGSPARPGEDVPKGYEFYARFFGPQAGISPDVDPDAFLAFLFENVAIVGDAGFVRERLTELRRSLGLDSLIAWQNFGGLTHEESLGSMRRLIDDVLARH